MRVFLHTGAGKTGTSAIQVALAALRSELGAVGIHYPHGMGATVGRAERGQVSSGNAFELAMLLNANRVVGKVERSDVVEWVNTAIAEADGRDLLFSSEAMQACRPDETEALCEMFAKAGYEVTVIFYVRHVLDMLIAGYLQFLKAGLIGNGTDPRMQDRSSFLKDQRCAYVRNLNPFARVLPQERVVVRLYDDERKDLVRNFLGLMTDAALDVPAASQVVNRSLTAAEQVMFEYLSAHSNGRTMCRVVSERLVTGGPPVSSVHTIGSADFAAFSERNKPVVDEVNTRFLRGRGELLLKSDKIVISDDPPHTPETVYQAFTNVLALFIPPPPQRR